VPGDVVVLSAGTVVPADIRLCESNMLYALETPITGSEESTEKDSTVLEYESEKPTFENMVYAGTIIRSGTGTGIVCFTSNNVRIRRKKKNPQFELLPDLIKYSSGMKNRTALSASVISFLFLFLGLILKRDIISLFICGAAVCASLILETANSLFALSFGKKLKKMLKNGAAVRNLNCISPLCDINSIMCGKRSAFPVTYASVRTVFADGAELGQAKDNETVIKLLTYAVVCSDIKRRISRTKKGKEMTYYGSPSEMALVDACVKLGLDIEDIKKSYFKIESDDMRSTDAYRTLALHENKNYFLMKGSPEYVLSYCTKYRCRGETTFLDIKAKRTLLNAARRMTENSQNVIAIASCETTADSLSTPSITRSVVFNGFIGIYMSYDIKSASAVLKCANAGIETVLKTPDDYETAVRMTKNSSILRDEKRIVSSEEIAEMGYDHYRESVMLFNVFLHPSDEQWMQTLKLRKSNGKKVLFTGEHIDELRMMDLSDVSTSLSCESNDTLRQSADVIMQSGGINVISDMISYAKAICESISAISSHALALFTVLLLTYIFPVALNLDFAFRIDILIPVISVSFLILMLPACFLPPAKDMLSRKTEHFSKRFRIDEYILPLLYGLLTFVLITAVSFFGGLKETPEQAQTMAFIALNVSMVLMSSMRSYKSTVIKRSNVTKILFPVCVLTVLSLNAALILIPSSAGFFGFSFPGAVNTSVSFFSPVLLFVLYQLFIYIMKTDKIKSKKRKTQ
ncbi:MAG: cation-transporting P-type ATPase, partial [Clostridia bacterium]|nr:cation-transporting P-type ATPase [Clostridia bacterium]